MESDTVWIPETVHARWEKEYRNSPNWAYGKHMIDAGLMFSHRNNYLLICKLIDKQKYLLAKLKYGI